MGNRLPPHRAAFLLRTGYRVASAVIGGVVLTLVYMFVVVPLKTGVLPPNMIGLFAIGWLLNAAWASPGRCF
jgi:hypothetical protein